MVGNRERTIFAVVTDRTLYFYLAHVSHSREKFCSSAPFQPQLLLCTFKRDDEEVEQRGEYRRLFWRHNSTSICVTVPAFTLHPPTRKSDSDIEAVRLRVYAGDLAELRVLQPARPGRGFVHTDFAGVLFAAEAAGRQRVPVSGSKAGKRRYVVSTTRI